MSNGVQKQSKNIMIFGAGINQIELIKAAKNLGVITIAIDPQADPPGKPFADFYYQVDGRDYETTKAIAVKHKVEGIVTAQMEKPMRLMARLGQELNLQFNSPRVVEQCLDKWLMKQAFMRNKVPCAKGILIKADEKLGTEYRKDFNFPLIIKPRDSFSSRGVFKVDTYRELMDRLDNARSFASKGDVLIEEFLEGREFSVETITWRGRTTIVQFTQKYITQYPQTVEMAHLQPAELKPDERELIASIVIAGIQALEIDNSAAHTEVMLTQKGPCVIEIGARLGGDFISSYLTYASTGISMDRAAVQIALGIKPDLTPGKQNYSFIKYMELPIGRTVINVLPYNDLLQNEDIIFASIFCKSGDKIEPITDSGQRPACVMVKAKRKDKAFSRAEKYLGLLSKKVVL